MNLSAGLLIAVAAVFGAPASDPACSPPEVVIRPSYTLEFGFERGSAKLSQDELKRIESWTRDLKNYPKDTIEIVGYVGGCGGRGYSESLGLRRARIVARKLVNMGIDMFRVTVRYGGEYPNPTQSHAEKRKTIVSVSTVNW